MTRLGGRGSAAARLGNLGAAAARLGDLGAAAARLLLAAHSGLVYLFLYAPIAVLAVFSFNASRQTASWEGATLAWYGLAGRDALLGRAVGNSLLVAALATAAATALGTAAALGMERAGAGSRRLAWALLLLPVVIPEVVLGAALLSFFGAIGLRLSLGTVVAAHVVFSVSYAAFVVAARLAGLDPALAEAAADLGAGPWESFRRVTLPLALPGILAAALLVFTLSIDDYVVTSFVAGVGSTTLPLHIYSMLKVGVTPEVNAVSTLLLAGTVTLIAVAQLLLARGAAGAQKAAR